MLTQNPCDNYISYPPGQHSALNLPSLYKTQMSQDWSAFRLPARYSHWLDWPCLQQRSASLDCLQFTPFIFLIFARSFHYYRQAAQEDKTILPSLLFCDSVIQTTQDPISFQLIKHTLCFTPFISTSTSLILPLLFCKSSSLPHHRGKLPAL